MPEKKDATKEVEMKENGEATSTTAPSSTPPRPTTAPSTPAAGNKRKRNDDEGEGEVEDDLAEDSLADSPESEEKKGTKRMKAPHPSSPLLHNRSFWNYCFICISFYRD